MAKKIRTLVMFDGKAEEAMTFYVSLFRGCQIQSLSYYPEGPNEGKVQQAIFTLDNQEFICIDSPVKNDFKFSPGISIFVDCESIDELESAYGQLAQKGKVRMPMDNYGFSEVFAWVDDRFGVSWQLNAERNTG